MYGGFVGLAVETRLGVGEAVAGEDNLLLDQQRRAAAFGVELGAERHVACQSGLQGTRAVVDHADFQGRGAAENVLGLGRILHAGQLNDDAVGALLLNYRLGDAEFVDPVVQGVDVLLDGELADAFQRFWFEAGDQTQIVALADFCQCQVVVAAGQDFLAGSTGFGITETDHDPFAVAADAGVAHILVTQQAAQVGGGRVETFGDGTRHVDLQEEVHAAAQIEAEVHRQGMQRGQPLRRCGEQIERDDVLRIGGVRVEGAFQDVLGLQLGVGILEACLDADRVELDAVMGDAGGLQGTFDPSPGAFIDLERDLGTGDLHRRRFAVEIGQGVDEAEDQGNSDEDVFPEGITVHCGRGQ